MVWPYGLEQALGAGSRFQGEIELLTSRKRRESGLLGRLVMQAQHLGRQLVELEDPPDPAMIDGYLIAGLDNPREFPGREGVREGEPDDLVLHMERYTYFNRGFAACMGQGPVIEQTDEARALKALQIPPQLVVGKTGRVALLGEGGLTLENGAQPVIAR